MAQETFTETMKVTGATLLETFKKLLHEGNVRKITVIDKEGKVVFDFPLTFGVVGFLISAPLTALATIIVLAKEYTLKIEREGAKRVTKPTSKTK